MAETQNDRLKDLQSVVRIKDFIMSAKATQQQEYTSNFAKLAEVGSGTQSQPVFWRLLMSQPRFLVFSYQPPISQRRTSPLARFYQALEL